jgi:hypothetical protein
MCRSRTHRKVALNHPTIWEGFQEEEVPELSEKVSGSWPDVMGNLARLIGSRLLRDP